MSSKTRPVRVDLTKDLPPRARQPSAEAMSALFGGNQTCKGEFEACSQNNECCSNKCRKAWWISHEQRWTWECLPTWATAD